MNQEKLKQAEANFLASYPKGFADPGFEKILKLHNVEKMSAFAQQNFAPDSYSQVEATVAAMVKCISRSSMVSMFEKPKFRDFCSRLDASQKAFLVDSLLEFLHGNQQVGLESMVDLLKLEKLAKWSLLTVIPSYYFPTQEVFVKPTTAKGIIKYFDVEGLHYAPLPSWEFYQAYRKLINQNKVNVDSSLSPSNAAFSGFLMMSMQ